MFRTDLFDQCDSTCCLAAKWVEDKGCHRSHPARSRLLPVAALVQCRAGFPVLMILNFIVPPPRLSESCASRRLLRMILRRLFLVPVTRFPVLIILICFVSPSVNDPPFSSISAANNGLTSLRNVTQLRSALRVVGGEMITSGTTKNSHPFLFCLLPINRVLRHQGH